MDYLIYAILFVVALIYALFLNTPKGRHFADEYTWVSVVVGTAIVMIASWFLIPADAWSKVAIAFVVAGVPVVGRSLVNKYRR